jgi:hypothetical protein
VKIAVKGQAHARLRELPAEVLDKVDSKLTSGEPARAVAQWLQEDAKLLTDMKPDTLKKTLERYREGHLRNKVLSRITEAQHTLALKTVQKRLNALDELEELVVIQRGRVDKMLMMEKDKPILLKSTTDEIRLLKEMLVDLGRVQMETGVLPKASRKISGTIMGADGEISQFSWTEEQEQLYQELERVYAERQTAQ